MENNKNLLSIKAGLIKTIDSVEGSDKLYKESVSFGETEVQILSGLRGHVPAEKFLNQKFLFLTNMKPRKLRGEFSHGMILCAGNKKVFEPLRVPEGVSVGQELKFEGFAEETCKPVLKDKKLSKETKNLQVDVEGYFVNGENHRGYFEVGDEKSKVYVCAAVLKSCAVT